MGPFKKYVTCIMAFFATFNFVILCQFYSNISLWYSLNFTKKLYNESEQRSGILKCLCKYSIVVSDKLVGSFLDVLSLLLAVILSELLEKPKKERLS